MGGSGQNEECSSTNVDTLAHTVYKSKACCQQLWAWQQCMGVAAVHGRGSSAWAWQQCMGVAAVHGRGSSAWAWQQCMGVAAVYGCGSSAWAWQQCSVNNGLEDLRSSLLLTTPTTCVFQLLN